MKNYEKMPNFHSFYTVPTFIFFSMNYYYKNNNTYSIIIIIAYLVFTTYLNRRMYTFVQQRGVSIFYPESQKYKWYFCTHIS